MDTRPYHATYGEAQRLFPDPILYDMEDPSWFKNIRLTQESISCMTPYKIAKNISYRIIQRYIQYYNKHPTTIVDATANVGGNCLSFSKEMDTVLAIEIKKDTCDMLRHNIMLYNRQNVKIAQGDCKKLIPSYASLLGSKPDIVFIDPPWFIEGKPNTTMSLQTTLSNYMMSIDETIINIWKYYPSAMVAIKVPKKYKTALLPVSIIYLKKMNILKCITQ